MHSFPPARPDARTSQLACLPLFPRGSLIAFHCVPFASSVYRLAGQWCLPYYIRSSVKNDDHVLALVSLPQANIPGEGPFAVGHLLSFIAEDPPQNQTFRN